jgi:hypothetical protein
MEKLRPWATRVVAGPTVRQAEQAQHWDDRRSQSSRVMRGICRRRSGRTWREKMWNRFNWEKQMMSDANRSVRPGVVAQGSTALNGHILLSPSGPESQRGVGRLPASFGAAGPPHREVPWLGLSRVKGNFHARFLGGREREPLAPTRRTSARESKPAGAELPSRASGFGGEGTRGGNK